VRSALGAAIKHTALASWRRARQHPAAAASSSAHGDLHVHIELRGARSVVTLLDALKEQPGCHFVFHALRLLQPQQQVLQV
jgi:hypothetical protein